MKALTLWPEWAHAICWFGKRIENRGWAPPKALTGERLAIHAGKHVGGEPSKRARSAGMDALEIMCFEADLVGVAWMVTAATADRDAAYTRRPQRHTRWREVITSAVVCTAVLSRVSSAVSPAPPWAVPGAVWWHLRDVLVLDEPVPCRGRQGLWTLPEDVEQAIIASTTGDPR